MDQEEKKLDQGLFDRTLTAIVATCSQVERIGVGSSSFSPIWDCKALLAWLALHTGRHLELNGTDFEDESGAELAIAMLTSNALEMIQLSDVPSLTRAVLSPVHLTSFPPLRPLLNLHLSSVTFSNEAIELLATLLCSTPKLQQLDLTYKPLPDSQLSTILRALPQWLSRRGAVCRVNFSMESDACANDVAAAFAQTRNSHMVEITICTRTSGVSLDAQRQLVAATASTSWMALSIVGANRLEEVALRAYGRQLHVKVAMRKEDPRRVEQCWFHSPRTLPD
ncbi:hypothetical protein SPRG_09319 [Saprolegnia parasitica CBS 223.65]|uniref:F-box domain-containing protein n=1 Tax=Saprolegnia parasitica (strain CBS 223.65) TaxID=695850 RepID=A0A067C4D4_SAPPC|nr:hypothetical protein SPRG_09319 [Saprolegnia parasitica CBS 223.65]KDO25378.1 hypothetical protein SPRG_09319 [Saprolegnia parasitica CBS 223.65]|eukprot:XP_012203806.1 hypothetical protein SPRG_09319 [Saprolegnia parasitica CBS 223.65]